MDTIWVHFRCTTTGTPQTYFFNVHETLLASDIYVLAYMLTDCIVKSENLIPPASGAQRDLRSFPTRRSSERTQ